MREEYLQQIANSIFLNHYKVRENGLQNGRMGMALFLYLYARHRGEKGKNYEELADDLLKRMLGSISWQTEPDFLTGLAGIGWGIRWLRGQNLIETDQDVLEDFDRIIYERTLKDCIHELNTSSCPIYTNGLYASNDQTKESLTFTNPDFLKRLLEQTEKQILPISFLLSVWYVYRTSVHFRNGEKNTKFEEQLGNLLVNSCQIERVEKADAYLLNCWMVDMPEWRQRLLLLAQKQEFPMVASWRWIVYAEQLSVIPSWLEERAMKLRLNNLAPTDLSLDGLAGWGIQLLSDAILFDRKMKSSE